VRRFNSTNKKHINPLSKDIVIITDAVGLDAKQLKTVTKNEFPYNSKSRTKKQ
jgi:hypothetical protein